MLLDCMDKYLQAAGAGGLQLFFPVTKYIQPYIHIRMKHNMESIVGFIRNEIENHQQEFDTENLRDYIDVYLNEKQKAKKQNREFVIDNNNLAVTVSDLFMAGTDTSASTLRWAILYMMAYPDIQDRIQRELDSVVGRNRLPRLADKTELPFTCATLLEIQRAGSIAPLGFMHCSQEDTTLAGYKVPKGSIVVSNLWSVHHDSELWDNLDEFNPERFVDDQGVVKERVELIPFSIGRRICIGDHLAKMELFIFFTHLLHQFKFTKPEDSPALSFEGITGIVFSPQPFLTQATVRQ
ncbi:cytochrome P450 2U1-like [Amphiura filiformis]|uniref:cytochrome P450 2U1-like n=1 Tax=Amphiura filiformis TaxID=82378 RepID=UPI003B222C4A